MLISTLSVVGLLSVVPRAFAAPNKLGVEKIEGQKNDGSYIVKLKDGASKISAMDYLKNHLDDQSSITYDYNSSYFNAFSGKFSPQALEEIMTLKTVEYIAEDAMVYAYDEQRNAPWGLQRSSRKGPLPRGSNPNVLNYNYKYPTNPGTGVNVYVLDTGINLGHVNFNGRAVFGYSAVQGTADGNGHGTHCAGTAVGSLYGLAKNSKVIAVKVLTDEGSGSTSGIIAGINWVVSQHRQTNRPSIISMSLGGSANTPLDNAVTAAVRAGIHVVVAAGNDNDNAAKYSPARASSVITVGAIAISDVRASFSNFGSVVDVYAPGQNVISSWIGSNTATKNISGTSMATPHVAGILAVYIAKYGNMSPENLTKLVISQADRTSTGLIIPQVPSP
ncbi:subtilisin-like serine protease [Tulasnella sp. 418]|nr:subtilisin-like serine protease [Tulasnella sp. 418]